VLHRKAAANLTAKSSRAVWPLLAVLVITLGSLWLWWAKFQLDDNTLKIAKVLKVDPYQLNTVHKIRDSMAAGHPLTESQWQQLVPLINGSNTQISADALTILASTEDTQFSQRSVDIARRYIDAPTGIQRAVSLAILYYHRAPDWRQTAEKLKTDENPIARDRALDFLSKGEPIGRSR
jgi:hypothetical protein